MNSSDDIVYGFIGVENILSAVYQRANEHSS